MGRLLISKQNLEPRRVVPLNSYSIALTVQDDPENSPRTTSLCSCIFLVLSDHVCCLHLKMEFRLCARGRQWCGIIHYY